MKPAQWHENLRTDVPRHKAYVYGMELEPADVIEYGDVFEGSLSWWECVATVGGLASNLDFKVVRPVGNTISGRVSA